MSSYHVNTCPHEGQADLVENQDCLLCLLSKKHLKALPSDAPKINTKK